MTERKIREYATHKMHCEREKVGGTRYPDGRFVYCSCGYDEAVFEPPDIVALVWRLKDQQFISPLRWQNVNQYIALTFGIRVTDEGWEYTDADQGQATTE